MSIHDDDETHGWCIVIAGHVGFLLEQDQVAAAHIRELPVLSTVPLSTVPLYSLLRASLSPYVLRGTAFRCALL